MQKDMAWFDVYIDRIIIKPGKIKVITLLSVYSKPQLHVNAKYEFPTPLWPFQVRVVLRIQHTSRFAPVFTVCVSVLRGIICISEHNFSLTIHHTLNALAWYGHPSTVTFRTICPVNPHTRTRERKFHYRVPLSIG